MIRDEQADKFWMFLCTGRDTGVAWSRDLQHWEFAEPLQANYDGLGTPECPDVFTIGSHTYLIVSPINTKSTIARVAADWRSPFEDVVGSAIDTPFLYAAKRMYDGKRHVISGWIRDLAGQRDDGEFLWSGTQCIPREVYVGSDPHDLCFRPVPEAVAQYPHTRVELGTSRESFQCDRQWTWQADRQLVGVTTNGAACVDIAAPSNYVFTCTLTPSEDAQVNLVFRARPRCGEDAAKLVTNTLGVKSDELPTGYTLHMAANYTELRGAHFRSGRSLVLPFGQPVTVTAFVQGTLLECFVNDAYAFSCRAYDFRNGQLLIELIDGSASISDLTLRTHEL
ncbi:MAG: hypothetical protein ACYC3X_09230 [Pirellulaceae bacterium]